MIGHCGEVMNKDHYIIKSNIFHFLPNDFTKVSSLEFKRANDNTTLVLSKDGRKTFIKRKPNANGRWFIVAHYSSEDQDNGFKFTV
jgi:hypothetical protein